MTEISKLTDMGSDHLGELGENQIISVSDHVNGLQHSTTKSDSFVVDMERFSHLIEKDTISANSRITLQRNLSRKGSIRSTEKKVPSSERDVSMLTTSPRGASMPEKSALVVAPQVHHQITITNGSTAAAVETKCGGKRFTFRRIDPRRILFLFATLSCLGTILLIYFTLSMANLNANANGDEINALN